MNDSVTHELIQKSIKHYTLHIKNLDSNALVQVIKNYKLLLLQMDEGNVELIKHLIYIAENILKSKNNSL